MLGKHHPIFINVHFNHPSEITALSAEACNRLADAGIPLGNQTVLLREVNNSPATIKRLCQKLLAIRVKPYYLYQADMVQGTNHFRTRIKDGLRIISRMRGFTSGMACPTYVVDGPGGKVQVSPYNILKVEGNEVTLANYEGKPYVYRETEPAVAVSAEAEPAVSDAAASKGASQ
jgi:lysine 2,3-aminomutase